MFNKKLFNYIVYKQFGGKDGEVPKWKTFKHNGVLFTEPYKPHKIPLIYNGEKIILDPISEEYASIYAKFTGTEYIKNNYGIRDTFTKYCSSRRRTKNHFIIRSL